MSVLLGGAIGDALGVPFESMKKDNPYLLSWDGESFLGSKHHNLFPGQFSDDHQLSRIIAESLIKNGDFCPEDLASQYRYWINSGIARGYGNTCYKAVQNLNNGVHWSRSGIPGSFGNGTAMRAAPFGIFFRNDIDHLPNIVSIDAAITHCSEDAIAGSIAMAVAVAMIANGFEYKTKQEFLGKLCGYLPYSNFSFRIDALSAMYYEMERGNECDILAETGSGANVLETVPAALHCFLSSSTYEEAVVKAIRAGGDTDTTASCVGSLFGAKVGLVGIPSKFYQVEDFHQLVELDKELSKGY